MTDELQAMSYEELLEQAEVLGVDGADAMAEADLRTALASQLESSASNKKPATRKKAAPKASADPFAETVRIVVEESDNDRQPAYVGVNGRSYRIKRGVEVDVPRPVANVLLSAKQKVRNPDGTDREVPTYPTRIVA